MRKFLQPIQAISSLWYNTCCAETEKARLPMVEKADLAINMMKIDMAKVFG